MNALRPLVFFLLLAIAGNTLAAAHAVVFMYHRFGENRYPTTSIRLEQFDAQLEYLAHNGFEIWPLQRVVEQVLRGEPLPDRTVALTVDDAYLSVYLHAWPRLKARGWPFTVFVNTDPVDRGLPDFMSWAQMREMQASGVSFANHGASHDSMAERHSGEDDASWERRMREDIERAERRLVAELGPAISREPRLFAYPYGEYDTRAADLVRALGYIGMGQQSGVVGPLADVRALPRYPMAEHFAALEPFARKATSLPLPVTHADPWDARASSNNPPRLTLTLAQHLPGLLCYEASGAPLQVSWLDANRLQVQAPQPLHPGRNRYNCTAPADNGRWYWYSHPWLITLPAVSVPPVPVAPTH